MEQTDNLNILRFKPLLTPDELKKQFPKTDEVARLVASSRMSIHDILANKDKRRLVITGPCSLHDREATLEYAGKLAELQGEVSEKILIIMRGGAGGPNYASEHVAFARILLSKANVATGIVIDCSHANSNKDHRRQGRALFDVAEQIGQGNRLIAGVMLESFLREGNQPIDTLEKLEYGLSLTDKCIGWEETEELIRHLADSL